MGDFELTFNGSSVATSVFFSCYASVFYTFLNENIGFLAIKPALKVFRSLFKFTIVFIFEIKRQQLNEKSYSAKSRKDVDCVSGIYSIFFSIHA